MPQAATSPGSAPTPPQPSGARRVAGRHPRLQALFADYGQAHRHPSNRVCHELAIPVIALTVVAMLDWVPIGEVRGHRLTLALAAWAAAAAWYVWMDFGLGLLVAGLLAAFIPLGRALGREAVIALALVAWTAQLAGHVVFERNRPSFLSNLVHALVGPVYFLAAMVDLGRGTHPP